MLPEQIGEFVGKMVENTNDCTGNVGTIGDGDGGGGEALTTMIQVSINFIYVQRLKLQTHKHTNRVMICIASAWKRYTAYEQRYHCDQTTRPLSPAKCGRRRRHRRRPSRMLPHRQHCHHRWHLVQHLTKMQSCRHVQDLDRVLRHCPSTN